MSVTRDVTGRERWTRNPAERWPVQFLFGRGDVPAVCLTGTSGSAADPGSHVTSTPVPVDLNRKSDYGRNTSSATTASDAQ